MGGIGVATGFANFVAALAAVTGAFGFTEGFAAALGWGFVLDTVLETVLAISWSSHTKLNKKGRFGPENTLYKIPLMGLSCIKKFILYSTK
jgi:hypothetical protein